MRESARKRHYYKKKNRKNRTITEQYKSISRKDRESKEIYNTQLNKIL